MYFHESTEKGYFVLQNIGSQQYLENIPNLRHDIHHMKLTNALNKTKKFKTPHHIFQSIRLFSRNRPVNTFFPQKFYPIVHFRAQYFEYDEWLGAETSVIEKNAIPSFTTFSTLHVLQRNTTTKTFLAHEHDLNAFHQHAFYRSRSNNYFGYALTAWLLKKDPHQYNPQTEVILAFKNNIYEYEEFDDIDDFNEQCLDSKTIKKYFVLNGVDKNDMDIEIVDMSMAMIIHNTEKRHLIMQVLQELPVECIHTTIDAVLQQNEIQINTLRYTSPISEVPTLTMDI